MQVEPGGGSRPRQQPHMPAMLVGGAAICWRLLVVGVTVFAVVMVLNRLTIVVLPLFVATFFAALLNPPVRWLRQHRWRRMAATWAVLLAALLVLFAIGYLVVRLTSSGYPALVSQFDQVQAQFLTFTSNIPGLGDIQGFGGLGQRGADGVWPERAAAMGGGLPGGRSAGGIFAGLVIACFLTDCFLADGDRIWSWMVRLFPDSARPSVNGAGHCAFWAVSDWVRGTALVALFHGVVIGTVLWLLGTPLVLPLATLVFLGSFIPLVGAVMFGGLAVVVTLVSGGLVPALILLAVLLVENQVEAHILQPFVVGKSVRLHPVAIVLVLTAGGALAGLIGAIVAVPLAAATHAAVKYLTGLEDLHGNPLHDQDRMEPIAPPDSAPLPYLRQGASHERGSRRARRNRTSHRSRDVERSRPATSRLVRGRHLPE